jgi:hypothetical protein
MSTSPITPNDQNGGDVWQPTVTTSGKDAKDETKAAAKYDSTYGGSYTTTPPPPSSPPGTGGTIWPLSMAYTAAPDLIPVPESPGSSSGSTVPLAEQFNVDLGAVRSTEQTFLTATSNILNAYQTLSTTVQSAVSSDSIFGQLDTTPPATSSESKYGSVFGDGVQWDNLDDEGKDFATSVDPQMQQLLASVSDIIESMGQFNALLNNAAQMYTDTDASSAFPAPGNV